MKYASEIATVIGIGLGIAGFVLSVINFRRDQAKLQVSLSIHPHRPSFDVEIANVGRRSAFVKRIGLRFCDKRLSKWQELASKDINRSLSEGDAPIKEIFMRHKLPSSYRDHFQIRAFAVDQRETILLSQTILNNNLLSGSKRNKNV